MTAFKKHVILCLQFFLTGAVTFDVCSCDQSLVPHKTLHKTEKNKKVRYSGGLRLTFEVSISGGRKRGNLLFSKFFLCVFFLFLCLMYDVS